MESQDPALLRRLLRAKDRMDVASHEAWPVERLAAVSPVVLVVEDAQYADAGLLDFLDYLIDWVRGLPVFILVLSRPELGVSRDRHRVAGSPGTVSVPSQPS